MRDERIIAEHRGGKLTKEQHHLMLRWAIVCTEHVLPLLEKPPDPGIVFALHMAQLWEKGNAPTGQAMKASVGAHAAARAASDPVSEAIARSAGHAAATAHMADHAVGAAIYALKALKLAGKKTDEERNWQHKQLEQLSSDLSKLIFDIWQQKEKILLKNNFY
jgi:hypothetical protein